MDRKTIWKRITAALLPAYLLTAAWTFFHNLFSDPSIPLAVWIYHGVFPLFLGISAWIAAWLTDGNINSLHLQRTRSLYLMIAPLTAAVFVLAPFALTVLAGIISLEHPDYSFALLGLGLPGSIVMALGEETMWRGFLFTQLRKIYSIVPVCFITGILWAAWHFPIIAQTHFLYADKPIWFSFSMLTIMTIALSFIYTWFRLRSGSIWPCVLLHAVQNYIAYLILQPAELPMKPYSVYFTGDIGIFYMILLMIGAFLFYRSIAKKNYSAS